MARQLAIAFVAQLEEKLFILLKGLKGIVGNNDIDNYTLVIR